MTGSSVWREDCRGVRPMLSATASIKRGSHRILALRKQATTRQ